jgi:hypothetical protein
VGPVLIDPGRDAEVDELQRSIHHQEVGWLQVEVDHAFLGPML